MSTLLDRNPSPPPEILRNDEVLLPDRIGNSVYSKQWLYKTLMSIMKVFERNEGIETRPALESEANANPSDTKELNTRIEELDSKIEEDACTLWDMSANHEVAGFLYECGVVDIFLEAIDKTKSPRLLEIIIGILANMSSFDSTCQSISKNKTLLCSVILLSGTSDSPTLLQVFRLINCGIANKASQDYWFDAFEENSFFMENMKFILENNLNGDVLKGAFQVLDRILNERISYCYVWGHQPYTLAVITAGDQLLKDEAFEELDQFFCMVNTLFQHTPNIKAYADNFEVLQPLFIAYFWKMGSEEILPRVSRISAVSCSFAVYGTLLKTNYLKKELVKIDAEALNSIYKIALSVRNIIVNLSKMRVDASDNEDYENCDRFMSHKKADDSKEHFVLMMPENEYHNWIMLIEAIMYAIKALASYVKEENEKTMLGKISSLEIYETL